MRLFFVLLFAFALTCLIGCALTPEQQERMNELQANIEAIHNETTATAKQIERLYILQEAVRDAVEKGEMTPEMALEKLAQLGKEAKEAVDHYTFLKEKGGALFQDYKDLKEMGVPWWQTALTVIMIAVSIYTGKGFLQYKGAAEDMVRGVEKGDHPETKKKIAALSNGLIKKLVKKLT